MRKDLSIQDTFGELRGLSAEVMPPFLEAIRTGQYSSAAAIQSRVITCNVNLLNRTRGSDEEVLAVLLPYQLAFLKSMSDPFWTDLRDKIQTVHKGYSLPKYRLQSLHALRSHDFSCSRGMLLVEKSCGGPFAFPPVQDLYRAPYFSALKDVGFKGIPESTLSAFLCNPSLRDLRALALYESYVGDSFVEAFTDPLKAKALKSLEYLGVFDVAIAPEQLSHILKQLQMLPHLKILKLRWSDVEQVENTIVLPHLKVLDVRGDYLEVADVRARFYLSPDCEILL